jgi:GNAT superfamily N-acetyltransferase
MESVTEKLAETSFHKKDKEWSKITQLTRDIDVEVLKKYVADLEDLFPEANTHDGIDHSYRYHLPSLAEYDRLETDNIFVALNQDKVIGLMIAFNDEDATFVTSIVHPKFRLQGVFRALLNALRAVEDEKKEMVFEICDQSKSGVGCAKHLGLYSEPKLDYYMACKNLTAPNKPLPIVTFKVVTEADAHLIALIYEEDKKFDDEETEFNTEESISDCQQDMKNGMEFRVYFNEENELVGMVQYVCREEKSIPYILNFFVRPKYRSKGFGESILRNVVSYWLNERKKSPVELETPRQIASKLYKKCGFEVTQSYNTWKLPDKKVDDDV